MAADVEIKFCFACGEEGAVTSDDYIFCEECTFEAKYKGRTEDFLLANTDAIKYCYNCGKEFHRGRKWLICKEGCKLRLPLPTTTKIGTSQVEPFSQYSHGGKKQFTATQRTLQLYTCISLIPSGQCGVFSAR